MTAFYANPVKYPPKWRVRRQIGNVYLRMDYAGVDKKSGRVMWLPRSAHASAEDAVNNVKPLDNWSMTG